MDKPLMLSPRYKWILLGFLFVTFFLEQGTRQIYNAVLPQIKVDFAQPGITDTQLGLVGAVFSAVLGRMGEAFSMRTAFASLGVFHLLGAIVLLTAIVCYFKHDYIPQS